ncbi:DUF883 family protein [Legionella oakridgensis]|uniref:DUF883 domain-containing protein n=2 Tax=Legionella oakridgensis TaxID=29423 RepID=W0BA74_9GAMM|nr:hypothetical protein [Legionella oakridgensis]AHE65601.1 hypothetical protein Loa_00010 [Legionella oakridgensis ATCC 33761 = DSM 21215]ETO94541.1 hypothetical protein LOR_10c01070 [Legionella oakridgensis RV-2-2007]KTD38304.1 hypothetical protein Loak_1980 [Legionella oakridgensis]STY15564.1 Bacterial protein of uncharacterised function (DUF883) [Legionella longbeachae]
MDNVHKKHPSIDSGKSQVGEAAGELLKESRKLAQEIYEEGLHKVEDAQKNIKEYSDELLEKVRKNPLASVLIAAGVGFLLSSILRK